MRSIVFGSAGFFGSHLSARLLKDGFDVIGVDNLSTGSMDNIRWLEKNDNFKFIKHDIVNPINIDGPVDYIFDLACPSSPVDFNTMNLDILRVCSRGMFNMLELARIKDSVILHTSTSEVYGDPEVHPQTEDYYGNVNPIGPRSAYDEGKRFAEATMEAYRCKYNLKIRIARIFNTYGPRMRQNDGRVITNFICQAIRGDSLTVYGDGSQTRSFSYVEEQVEGLIRLIMSDYTKPMNIGNPVEMTVKELAEKIIELTNSSSDITYLSLPGEDPKLRCPDVSLSNRVLGIWDRIDLSDGLRFTIEHYMEII